MRLEAMEPRLLLDAALHGSRWLIAGDDDPSRPDDHIVIASVPGDPSQVQATLNGEVVASRPLARLRRIHIVAGEGDDVVEVDLPPAAYRLRITAYGGAGDDELEGGPGRDRLYGGDGADVLRGGGRTDALFGGRGDDELDGGPGRDRLRGGDGDDALSGGDGHDRLRGGRGADVLAGGEGRDRLYGSPGDDEILGEGDSDRLFGGRGSDVLRPGDGKDLLLGGSGIDVLYAKPDDQVRRDRADAVMGDPAESRLDLFESEGQFRERLIQIALERWGDTLGKTVTYPSWRHATYGGLEGDPWLVAFDSFGPEMNGGAVPDTSSANSYSGTNNQVDGVEEGDLVKTDGDYIYMITGGELVIVDTLPAVDIHVVSRTPVEGQPTELFLHGDRVAVASTEWGAYPYEIGIGLAPAWDTGPMFMPPYRGQVTFSVFDVADRQAPGLVQETRLEGSLIATRAVDEQLFAVVRNDLWIPPPIYEAEDLPPSEVDPDGKPAPPDGASPIYLYGYRGPWAQVQYTYETADEYVQRLRAAPLDDILPGYSVESASGEQLAGLLDDPAAIYLPPDSLSEDLLTVARIDLSADEPAEPVTTSVQGSGGHVYASRDSLYVAGRPAMTWRWAPDVAWDSSRIYKFDLTRAEIPLAATGVVAGTLNNQFSMDERDGLFRIATTTNSFGLRSSNSLFVLQQDGDELVSKGALTNLAVSERIYSVRYVDDLAYMVTFRQIDPLFVIDLSDPTKPTVAGELKVPGFSSYLHPAGESRLIGVGRDADETGRTRGLKLSLFGVADPTQPQELDVMLLGTGNSWGSSSEALWDHHAFAYFPTQQVLTLPVRDWADTSLHSLYVIQVGEAGFTELGQIASPDQMRRSVRINENVYAISQKQITVADLSEPSEVIAVLSLTA